MKNGLFKVFTLCLLLPLTSCNSEDISTTLTFLPYQESTLFYVNSDGDETEIAMNDPLFAIGLNGGYSYTAKANSEFPDKIKTLGSKLDGYHFSGWQLSVNGTLKGSILKNFSNAKMPYVSASYQAVFNKNAKVKFVPTVDGVIYDEIEPIVLDSYVTDTLLNSTLVTYVYEPLNEAIDKDDNLKDRGIFTHKLYLTADGEDTVSDFTVSSEELTYYIHFSSYPTLTIMNYDGTSTSYNVKINSNLSSYQPEDPKIQGKVFDGWYLDETYETSFNFNQKMADYDLTIYPKFLNEIKVVLKDFDADNSLDKDLGNIGVETKKLDGSKLLYPLSSQAHQFSTFEFWYYDKNDDGIYNYDDGDIQFDVTTNENYWVTIPSNLADNTLYLKPYYREWQKLTFDLTNISNYMELSDDLLDEFVQDSENSNFYYTYKDEFTDIYDYISINNSNFKNKVGSEHYYLKGVNLYIIDSNNSKQYVTVSVRDELNDDGEVIGKTAEMPDEDLYIEPVVEHYIQFTIHKIDGTNVIISTDSNGNYLKYETPYQASFFASYVTDTSMLSLTENGESIKFPYMFDKPTDSTNNIDIYEIA